MAHTLINVLLEHNLPYGGSVTIPYPVGKNHGHFFSAVHHSMAINASFFKAPQDFIIDAQPDRLILTWRGAFAIPAGTLLNLQLEEPCGEFYRDLKNGTVALGVCHSQLFLVNVGFPAAADGEYFIRAREVPAPGPLELAGMFNATPRNVVLGVSAGNADCPFVIEGEDLYGRKMIEHLAAPAAAGVVEGQKSFQKVTRIAASHACKGTVKLGTGNRLGLPVFLPGRAFLMREIVDGDMITGGVIVPGSTILPAAATTGDRRGTYTPPASHAPDGKRFLQLMLSLPNPGNIGAFDYAG